MMKQVDPAHHQRASEAFAAVIAAAPAQREGTLSRVCGNDTALRESVESLLRYHNRANVLDDPSFWGPLGSEAIRSLHNGAGAAGPRRSLRLGVERIGRYRVLDLLGEGGMGAVYLAEQDKPRRTVALKVLHAAMPSHAALRRFEFEQEALGRLQHPGIAQIYESGADERGRPYFAMEYVPGQPLIDFASSHELTTAQKLELMIQICDAVQHAHQRGLIHRDLKPANILVIEKSGSSPRSLAQPKILDFGVARAVNDAAQTLQTQTGQLVGTLAYMSPEQLSADPDAVDIRTDVYALGVMLFELLTKRLPHDLRGASLPAAARRVAETVPLKLSAVDRALRGDLDTITSKALEHDAKRRYQSAAELADDLRRSLQGLPILARHDSALYVLRRQMKRYQRAAAIGVLFMLTLAAFAAYAIVQAQTERELAAAATTAGQAALAAQQSAESARQTEAQQRQTAQRQAERANAVTTFLVETLGFTDPDIAQDPDMTVDALLNQASDRVSDAFEDQPEAEAIVRTVIGRAYASQGELELAEQNLQKALDLYDRASNTTPAELYEVLWPYYHALHDIGDPRGIAIERRLLETGFACAAGDDPRIVEIFNGLQPLMTRHYQPQAAEPLAQQLRERLTGWAVDDPRWVYVADQLYVFGAQLRRRGQSQPALEYINWCLDILEEHFLPTNSRRLRAMHTLARCCIETGEETGKKHWHVEAEQIARAALASVERVLPPNHWYVAVHRARVGMCLVGQQQFEQAEGLLAPACELLVNSGRSASPLTHEAFNELIALYERWTPPRPQHAEAARQMLARALVSSPNALWNSGLKRLLGPDRLELYQAILALERAVGDPDRSLTAAIEHAVAVRRRFLADDSAMAAVIAGVLIRHAHTSVINDCGSNATRPLVDEILAIDKAGRQLHPYRRASVLSVLGHMHERLGEYEQGEQVARAMIALVDAAIGDRYGDRSTAQSLLGGCLAAQGKTADAEPLLRAGFEGLMRTMGYNSGDTTAAMLRLAEFLSNTNRAEEASRMAVDWLLYVRGGGRNAASLNGSAWNIVQRSFFTPAAYEAALENARLAVEADRSNGKRLNTFAGALYRLSRYDEALQALQECERLNASKYPDDAALLAMTCCKLGRLDEANQHFARFRSLLEQSNSPIELEHKMFLRELEGMLGGMNTP